MCLQLSMPRRRARLVCVPGGHLQLRVRARRADRPVLERRTVRRLCLPSAWSHAQLARSLCGHADVAPSCAWGWLASPAGL